MNSPARGEGTPMNKWMLLLCLLALPAAADDYADSVERWRAQRLAHLQNSNGWLTLVGLFWLQPGRNSLGCDPQCDFRLAEGPGQLGTYLWQDGRLHFSSESGVELNGSVIYQLDLDAEEKEASTILRRESLSWYTIRRDGRLGLRVKDSHSPTLRDFKGVPCFAIDPAWRIEGRFEAYPTPQTVRASSVVQGVADVSLSPGELVFDYAGQTYCLQVIGESGEPGYEVVFGDRSNGHQTYAGGRFLPVEPADAQGRVVLDFNKAYNPPCCFTPYATCALPSPQNRLDFAVTAGEKFAGH